MKTAATILLLALGAGYAVLLCQQAIVAPTRSYDDREHAVRVSIWPLPMASGNAAVERWLSPEAREWAWQPDVPSLDRWTVGAILWACNARFLGPLPDYKTTWEENQRNGGIEIPAATRNVFRLTNVFFFLAGLAALVWAASLVLPWPLALLTAAPIMLTPTLALSVAYRIGPDALLMCMSAVTILVWLRLHHSGKATGLRGVVIIGAFCGLTMAAKLNGSLVLAAYAGFLATQCRGLARFNKPLAAVVVALGVYAAVNPALLLNLSGAGDYARIAWLRRAQTIDKINGFWGPLALADTLGATVPVWPLLPILLIPAWLCRREPWFAPVAWWGGALLVGTLLSINRPEVRYIAPAEYGLYYPVALSALWLVRSRQARQ